MSTLRTPGRLTRRLLLADLGKVAVGAVLLSACGSDDSPSADQTTTSSPNASPSTSAPTPSDSTPDATAEPVDEGPGNGMTGGWTRLDRGFVSAYVVVRDGEAMVVDTGTRGTEDDLVAALDALGTDIGEVGHVLLTHKHDDHVGGLSAIAELAADATIHAGEGDIGAIRSPRDIAAVVGGDVVLGFEVIETPGHTPGHVCLFERASGLLLAGDAITGANGGVAGPNERFTPDKTTAQASVRTLAALRPTTILFGHGSPATVDAAANLQALADA